VAVACSVLQSIWLAYLSKSKTFGDFFTGVKVKTEGMPERTYCSKSKK